MVSFQVPSCNRSSLRAGAPPSVEHGVLFYQSGHLDLINNDIAGHVYSYHQSPDGPLLAADKGLFRFDGNGIIAVPGGPTG